MQSKARSNSLSSKTISKDKIDVPASQYSMEADFFPCPRIFTLQCLLSLDLSAAQAKYDWMPACLGTALYMDCPLIAMTSDYHVCSRPNIIPEPLKSMTINDLKIVTMADEKFYSIEKDNGRIIVKLNVYQPDKSPLKDVPATSRPLIALLMDHSVVPKLPDAIKVEPNEAESFNAARLRSVVDYVSKTNPIYVLREIMESSVSSGQADYLSETVLTYLERFCPDFAEASQILILLGLGQGLPLIKAAPGNKKHQKPSKSSPGVFFERAAKLLKGCGHEDESFDFFYRWPKALVHLYRCGSLENVFIEPLYNKWGVFFGPVNGYLSDFPHCCGPSRILRYIHYCLIAGVDEANGAQFKLIGLKSNARELCYEGKFRYKMYNIHVLPMYLPGNCSSDDFLCTILGFDCASDVPKWSLALIFSILLWHQQKTEHKSCRINECPLVLSTILLALVAYLTPKSDLPALADHLDELKTAVIFELADNGAPPSPALEKEFLHGALELMILYDHYVSLSHLLTALQTPNVIPDLKSPIYNRFPQIHIAFPSLKLLVNIACHLKTQESPSAIAQRKWLVKAFRPVLGEYSSVQALQEAVWTFSSVMRILQKTKLVFEEPKVDVSDPPRIFLCKEERSSLMRDSISRRNNAALKPNKNISGENLSTNRKDYRSQIDGRRSKKSESYAERLSKRLGEMKLNSP